MPLILPGNVGSATAATGFNVANSCRFNSGSSDFLGANQFSNTAFDSTKKFTLSVWVKKTSNGVDNSIFGVESDVGSDGKTTQFYFDTSDQLRFYDNFNNVSDVKTNRVFRDNSAFYNIILAVDYTQSTNSNRVKIIVNGEQETSLATSTYANQNDNITALQQNRGIILGVNENTGGTKYGYFNGYMSEFVFLDGIAADQTSFGEVDSDSGIFKPIDVSGLTFGTNGFYLDFEDSSALGNDAAGSNNFTVNNLTAIDQSTDTCTNNFATLNPLDNVVSQAVFTEGNLKSTMNNSNSQGVGSTGTFWVSSGKWYVEAKLINNAGDNGSAFGVTGKVGLSTASADRVGNSADAITYTDTGQKAIAGSYTNSYGSSFTNGDIIGIYIDLDNLKIYFAKNGSLQNSGTGLTLNAIANTLNGVYTFSVGMNAGTGTPVFEINFGGTQTYSISSAVTDDNGYGNFEYSPNITGDSVAKKFYSMCTKNLAEYG